MRKLRAVLTIFLVLSGIIQSNGQGYWQLFTGKKVPVSNTIAKPVKDYKVYQLDETAIRNFLSNTDTQINHAHTLLLPTATGSIQKFYVWETPVMEPGLAAKYPDIQTFTAVMEDNPSVTAKLEYTSNGFSAIIFDGKDINFIAPYSKETSGYYIVYKEQDRIYENIICLNNPLFPESYVSPAAIDDNDNQHTAERANGNIRQKYRFAMSCTGEYARLISNNPTKPVILSEMVATTNHINGYYEREFAFSLTLVNNNDAIIYTDTATDPYTCNLNCECLIDQANNNVKAVIGVNNFDIGYTLCTAGGGLAAVGALCDANGKAAGVGYSSGSDDIAVLIHEMGHQFGSSHTFNANTGGCLNNATAADAFEPGAGISIMSYAGGCDPNSVGEKEPFYHVRSLMVIADHISNQSSTCGTTVTGSNPISIAAITDTFFCIPQNTPFELTAPIVSHDANTAILYNWEQWDLGNFQSTESQNALATTGPLFKSHYPVEARVRAYPSVENIFAGTYGDGQTGAGQRISKKERDIHFKLTVRSILNGWGSYFIPDNDIHIRTAKTATNFRVTQPAQDESWNPGTPRTITWNVSQSDGDTVKCKWVNIFLSEDDGVSFPHLLVANAPNTGSYTLTVPNVSTTSGRIKVKASGGIFFDLAKGKIAINGTTTGIQETSPSITKPVVYPNPANDVLFIENNTSAASLHYQLYNGLGQEVKQGVVSKRIQLSTAALPRGIYFIRFTDHDTLQDVQSIILK